MMTIGQCLPVRVPADLNVSKSDMADHSPAQLRQTTALPSHLFKAGERNLSELGLLRHWLMGKLMPGGDLGKVCMSASCMFVP